MFFKTYNTQQVTVMPVFDCTWLSKNSCTTFSLRINKVLCLRLYTLFIHVWNCHIQYMSENFELNGCFCVSLSMYVCPVRPRSNVDGAGGSAGPVKMSVIEGEDAILPCEVRSVPPPTISWAKERQLISPFSPRYTYTYKTTHNTDFDNPKTPCTLLGYTIYMYVYICV